MRKDLKLVIIVIPITIISLFTIFVAYYSLNIRKARGIERTIACQKEYVDLGTLIVDYTSEFNTADTQAKDLQVKMVKEDGSVEVLFEGREQISNYFTWWDADDLCKSIFYDEKNLQLTFSYINRTIGNYTKVSIDLTDLSQLSFTLSRK